METISRPTKIEYSLTESKKGNFVIDGKVIFDGSHIGGYITFKSKSGAEARIPLKKIELNKENFDDKAVATKEHTDAVQHLIDSVEKDRLIL
jgi:hypothetical protein